MAEYWLGCLVRDGGVVLGIEQVVEMNLNERENTAPLQIHKYPSIMELCSIFNANTLKLSVEINFLRTKLNF